MEANTQKTLRPSEDVYFDFFSLGKFCLNLLSFWTYLSFLLQEQIYFFLNVGALNQRGVQPLHIQSLGVKWLIFYIYKGMEYNIAFPDVFTLM